MGYASAPPGPPPGRAYEPAGAFVFGAGLPVRDGCDILRGGITFLLIRRNVMPPRRMSHPSRTGKPAPNTKAPAGSYALPGGGPGGADAYPINNPGRAHAALAYVEQHGTPAEKSKVRAA